MTADVAERPAPAERKIPVPIPFDPARHCGALRRSSDLIGLGRAGQPCRQRKGAGTDHRGSGHCKFHMGTTRNGKTNAATESAAAALEKLGVEVQIDPRAALLRMVREAWGNVIFLRERARSLGMDLIGDVMDATREGDLYATKEEVRALVKLYGDWTDRLVKYSKVAIDAGVAEAHLELERQKVEGVVLVFSAGIAAGEERIRVPSDVPADARERFRTWVEITRREMREAAQAAMVAKLRTLEPSEDRA